MLLKMMIQNSIFAVCSQAATKAGLKVGGSEESVPGVPTAPIAAFGGGLVLEVGGGGGWSSQSSNYHEDETDSLDEADLHRPRGAEGVGVSTAAAPVKCSSAETVQSTFSNDVILKFRKQLLFMQ